MLRFARNEAGKLKPLPRCGPFLAMRDSSRRTGTDRVEVPVPEATLLRPFAEYEADAGGAW